MTGIYKIISPNNKIYIGQSINIYKRWNSYKNLNCKRQIKLYRSLLKYGVDNHIFEIIEECDFKDLNVRERYWQDYYDVLNDGLNCCLTETDILPKKLSKETKKKISNLIKGIPKCENTKKKISLSRIGFKVSDDTKNKLRNVNLGKIHSEKTKLKMSINHGTSRIVINLQNGIFYDSVTEAAKIYNIKRATLAYQLSNSSCNKTYLSYV